MQSTTSTDKKDVAMELGLPSSEVYMTSLSEPENGDKIFVIPGWNLEDFPSPSGKGGIFWEYRRNRAKEILETPWVFDLLTNKDGSDRAIWFDQRSEYQGNVTKILNKHFDTTYERVFWDNKIRYGVMRRMSAVLWPFGPRLKRYATRREYRRMEPIVRLRVARAYWTQVAEFFGLEIR